MLICCVNVCFRSRKRSIFVLDDKYISLISSYIRHLTDLSVTEILDVSKIEECDDFNDFIKDKQIIVLTSNVCLHLFTHQLIKLETINLLVIDDCRLALKENSLSQVINNHTSNQSTQHHIIYFLVVKKIKYIER